jgi:peptide/nickel transport system permease protein
VLDQLSRDYVRTARGKGLPAAIVQLRHVGRNAAPVTISVLATVIGYQLGGAIIIEQIFAWPGLGSLLFESIGGRDYTVVQGTALLSALTYVVVNLFADLIRSALDPRLRSSH